MWWMLFLLWMQKRWLTVTVTPHLQRHFSIFNMLYQCKLSFVLLCCLFFVCTSCVRSTYEIHFGLLSYSELNLQEQLLRLLTMSCTKHFINMCNRHMLIWILHVFSSHRLNVPHHKVSYLQIQLISSLLIWKVCVRSGNFEIENLRKWAPRKWPSKKRFAERERELAREFVCIPT